MIADVNSQFPDFLPSADEHQPMRQQRHQRGVMRSGEDDLSTTQLAALKAAQARDGALIGLNDVNSLVHVQSRHLLADVPNDDSTAEVAPTAEATTNNNNVTTFNLTLKNGASNGNNMSGAGTMHPHKNGSMELMLINGTWHLVDVSICYQNMMATGKPHLNDSHINK
jgi:hypothetical protein